MDVGFFLAPNLPLELRHEMAQATEMAGVGRDCARTVRGLHHYCCLRAKHAAAAPVHRVPRSSAGLARMLEVA